MKIKLLNRITRNWAPKVLSLAAAVVLYFLTGINSMEERFITVQVDYLVPQDFTVYSSSSSRIPVTLRGNSDGLWDIAENDIILSADFRDVQDEGVFRRPITISRRGAALAVDSLEVSPEQTQVDAQIQRYLERRVPVRAQLIGRPALGHELAQVTVVPQETVVGGPRTLVESIQDVGTEELDLSGRTGDFTQRVSLVLPDPRLRSVDSGLVEIRGLIAETIVAATFTGVDIILIDVPDGFVLDSDLGPGEVQIQGPQLVLESLDADDITLVAEAGRLDEPGEYRVAVRPEVPQGLLVLQYQPNEIEVVLTRRGSFPGELQ